MLKVSVCPLPSGNVGFSFEPLYQGGSLCLSQLTINGGLVSQPVVKPANEMHIPNVLHTCPKNPHKTGTMSAYPTCPSWIILHSETGLSQNNSGVLVRMETNCDEGQKAEGTINRTMK